MISKSEEIDIVKLFPELDGSILYTQLTITMVKQMIDKDCKGLALDTLQPTSKASRHSHAFPSPGDFGSSVADHTMHAAAQKLIEAFLA